MDRKEFFGALPLATLASFDERRIFDRSGRVLSPAEERFVGVYQLISERSIGRIYYDAGGRMGAMLHPKTRDVLPESPTVDDYRAMLRGLVAYWGTYTVDESTTRVFHNIEVSLNPREMGGQRVRWYEFVGNRLQLLTRRDATTPLIWERLPVG